MVPIILPSDLENYPGVTATPDELDNTVDRVNALIEEAWTNPVDPVPQWVREIALTASARFLANPRGLASWTSTRSIDDATRSQTERATEGSVRAGLHLTAEELARLGGIALNRRRVGSIRLSVPGF